MDSTWIGDAKDVEEGCRRCDPRAAASAAKQTPTIVLSSSTPAPLDWIVNVLMRSRKLAHSRAGKVDFATR